MIEFFGFKNNKLTNNSIYLTNPKAIIVENYNEDADFDLYNNILDVDRLLTDDNVFNYTITTTSDNNVITTTENSLFSNSGDYIAVTNDSTTNIQESWNKDLSAYNPLQSSAINYLSNDFRTITISGNNSYDNRGIDWYDGDRDGVGALYFEKPDLTLSADITSANVSFTTTVSADSATSANYYNNSITYDFDGTTSSTSDLSASNTYNLPEIYDVSAEIESYNGWNVFDSNNTLNVSAYDSVLSADIDIYKSATSASTTSANTYEDLFVSGNTISGHPSSYEINFQTTSAEGSTDTGFNFKYDYEYTSACEPTIVVTIKNDIDQTFTKNIAFSAIDGGETYYVNINSSYTDEDNTGTTDDPLNWNEFLTYLSTSGDYNDQFKLKGQRTITRDTSQSVPYNAINADSDKGFVIDAWDLNAEGPYVINVRDFSLSNNLVLNFRGCTLKNGIIYNKPFEYRGSSYYGGEINISNLYNMWLVNYGTNSSINLYPVNDNVYIYGSTIYNTNSFDDYTGSDFNFYVVDSVVKNLTQDSTINTIDLYLYQSTTETTETTVTGEYTVSANSKNQFGWIAPSNWPMVVDCDGYDESLTYLIQNPEIFNPFSTITIPPNPGKNYSAYSNYETGLYGNNRRDYIL